MLRIPERKITSARYRAQRDYPMYSDHVFIGSAAAFRDHFEYIDGITLWVPQGVFCPANSISSQLMAAVLTDVGGKTILDLGTGSGFLAITAAMRGARRVIAIDIDPRATKAALKNVIVNGLDTTVKVVLSDLFGALSRHQFDTIVANLPLRPFHTASPTLPYVPHGSRSLIDENHRLLKAFLKQGALHIKPGGNMLFVVAGFSNRLTIMEYAEHCNWEIHVVASGNDYEIWNATK